MQNWGVIQLPALPLSAGFCEPQASDFLEHGMRLVEEARLCAGFDGLWIENYSDAPFGPLHPAAIAACSMLVAALRETFDQQLGLWIHGDEHAALGIASVTGCTAIRISVPSASLVRTRTQLGARSVQFFADIVTRPWSRTEQERLVVTIEELYFRFQADAIVVRGPGLGREPHDASLECISEIARRYGIPVFLGSGAQKDRLPVFAPLVDGVFWDGALRKKGELGAPLDRARVRRILKT